MRLVSVFLLLGSLLTSFHVFSMGKEAQGYSPNELVFVQSVMYQPLAKFCQRQDEELFYQEAFKQWQSVNQSEITQGSEEFTARVESQNDRVTRVIKMLIHQVEADWGGSDRENKAKKCSQLKEYLKADA
ncbi:hypothetical protein L2719_12050 [Shewanella schlegeliana]|uniref:Uncharacterized protein n=1 Tax=Shewanella schlegeliana TaxID=190308 RepID=A0ABS1STE1_9GAMM|nr:hypothetical protein [Shewanella schlegeliana]MBL4911768.1 hypothetical protein [Shewanella schlegeliana]MCL1110280.1 hypothetical protein [Shewanella schlegeliana]GIU31607.1 hypothetical protein TUM4433_23530 [Shewanella schlegeliana]